MSKQTHHNIPLYQCSAQPVPVSPQRSDWPCLDCTSPVKIEVTSVSKRQWTKAMLGKEMLVFSRYAGTQMGGKLLELDLALGKQISQSMARAHFKATLGEPLLVRIQSEHSDITLKYVLLVGLGRHEDNPQCATCALYGLATDWAAQLSVKTVTIPVLPERYKDRGFTNLRGLLSVLRCRVAHAPQGGFGELEKIEVVCAQQAKRHIDAGLAVSRQLCRECSHPEFCEEEQP